MILLLLVFVIYSQSKTGREPAFRPIRTHVARRRRPAL